MSTARDDTTGIRTYRGRSLEELIPRIREELGPDAIILREREGLTGGVGGFFAQRCVEVDARAASPVDMYDEEFDELLTEDAPYAPTPAAAGPAAYAAAAPTPTASEPAAPEPAPVAEPVAAAEPVPVATEPVAAPMGAPYDAAGVPVPERGPEPPESDPGELTFSERLELARRERENRFAGPTPAPAAPPTSEPAAASVPASPAAVGAPAHGALSPAVALDRAAAGAVARELVTRGLSEAWAHELIVSAAAHLAPFRGGSLREAVHACLASAITVAPPLPAAGAAVAFVGAGGAGKTRCVAAMAAAYRRASTLPVMVVSLGADGRGGPDAEPLLDPYDVPVRSARGGQEAAEAVCRGRDGGLVVIDARATSPVDAAGVAALSADLAPLALDAVLLALPATLSASAARNLLDGLAALQPSGLVITHADETDELGIAIELAYLSGVPIAYVHGGLSLEGALWPADPSRVAARLLP